MLIPGHPSAQAPRLEATAVASDRDIAMCLQGLVDPEYPPGVKDIKIFDSKGQERKSETSETSLQKCLNVKIFSSKSDMYEARIIHNPRVVGARDLLQKCFDTPLSLTLAES